MQLMNGDCLELMKGIPDGSVDLIFTDPPYGTMSGMAASEGISHGMQGKTEWDKALDPSEIYAECNRVLRTNGALILFSQEPYTSKMITEAHGNLPFSYRMVWLKDHFANALIAKKAPVSYFEDILVFFKKYDTLNQHPLRIYARKIMEHTQRNLKQINEDLGHRRAEHFFYEDSTQFGICTNATYSQIIDFYGLQHVEWLMSYEEILEIDQQFSRQFSRQFNLAEGSKFKSNVLQYRKDYDGHHPTQKPVALLDDVIRTYSAENNVVLDFTMGSGSTGVACVNTGRKFIGIEMDEGYFEIAQKRIAGAIAAKDLENAISLSLDASDKTA
jgi:DNA modification methylase